MLNGTLTTTQGQAFGPLPSELLLNVLDQLVETCNDYRPVVRSRFDIVTRTLHSLTLVSRSVHPMATEYLYSNCVWLDCPGILSHFCATLGLDHEHQTTVQNIKGPPKPIFSRYVTSIHISPVPKRNLWEDDWTDSIRLPTIINLFNTIGPNLKRLHLSLNHFIFCWDDTEAEGSYVIDPNIYSNMLLLEELIICCYVIGRFPNPPQYIKRLAIVTDHFGDAECNFYQSSPSLESLVFLRPYTMTADDVDTLVDLYQGESLDIILVDMDSYYTTPIGTRNWKSDHTVRIWEASMPPSRGNPSGQWIWDQGAAGTLWDQKQRRMPLWSEIEGD
ncbi:hypothetical protein COCMIDRAFT_29393 [Bipolaris oryzae ATCC 44560]|uniref:F-box domain-containing protein n=1 Tax=Bipolaris oryzae ATCC 44560 TaxID=930090 RepID=W6YWG0_COCMI|nr:uncharacterized protein COCMIDRAFT_29393 [Bipolaris oryzae ATCC 44560]EUC41900.1 hypothetical protein COCMIDRAFT_29393 [Bipolaris oryzae ATCC 44560]